MLAICQVFDDATYVKNVVRDSRLCPLPLSGPCHPTSFAELPLSKDIYIGSSCSGSLLSARSRRLSRLYFSQLKPEVSFS